jgi:sporulation protein YlmC with PRC-barrel domain
MRIDLDATVQTIDGQDAGSVKRAVIDPVSSEVTDFVVSTGGLFGYDVLVPRERLESAPRNGAVIVLDMTKEQLERQPSFSAANYGVPPTDWIPPLTNTYPLAAFAWPVSSRDDRPEREISAVAQGTPVLTHDGAEVGHVDEVELEPVSGRLLGVAVRTGGLIETLFGGGQKLLIEEPGIERIEPSSVRLRTTEAELKAAIDRAQRAG